MSDCLPPVCPCALPLSAPAMFPLLNMIREQAAATLIYESAGRMVVMHFVAFVLSLGCLHFYPNHRHLPADSPVLTNMRLVRQVYEHCQRVILPLCGAYELQQTAELVSGLGQATPDTIVRASSQMIAQAADLFEGKAAYVQLVSTAPAQERDTEVQRLAHIKWFGLEVKKSLGNCRTNLRFLKEFVHHVTRWASEVVEEIQDEVNPPARNVRPPLAEPDQEPPAHVPHARGPPSEPDQLNDDLE